MTKNLLRNIRFLQKLHLLHRQAQLPQLTRLIHPLHTSTIQPHNGHTPLPLQPRQRNLTHPPPLPPRNLLYPLINLSIRLANPTTHPHRHLPPRRGLCPVNRRGQKPPMQRTPPNNPPPPVPTKIIHLPLFLSIAEIVAVLHAYEFRPVVFLGDELQAGELVGPHAGGADVVDFSGGDEVVEGFHGFFGGDGGVVAVELEEVDVGCAEAGEGGVDGAEDGGAGETCIHDRWN